MARFTAEIEERIDEEVRNRILKARDKAESLQDKLIQLTKQKQGQNIGGKLGNRLSVLNILRQEKREIANNEGGDKQQ